MCGRYYVDDETAREIERLVLQMEQKLKHEGGMDIHPTDVAPVLSAEGLSLSCQMQRWGFQGFHGKQVIFNARCESVLEKPTFRESVTHRRVVIPATWFYEWNRVKEKNIFYRKEEPVLFMAGCYHRFEDGNHFVILTTAANAAMQPVHDRMPLILEREEISEWILNGSKTETFLHKRPCLLERRADYEQISLF